MPHPESKVLKQYSLIGDAIYYHHSRTEAVGKEYLHPSEMHAAHEMLLLLEGEISYIIEGETYTVRPGDMIFVAPGEIHAIRINGNLPYERMVLLFDIGVLQRMMAELRVELGAFCYGGKNRLHIIPRALVEEYGLSELMLRILGIDDRDPYKRLLIIASLLHFLIQTDKMVEKNKDRFDRPASKDALISAAVAYIDTHIGEPIRLDEMAKDLFVSKSTLCHKFAKAVHMTTNRYITLKKMHRAAEYMRKGCSAAKAASLVGYENYTSFFYNFKRLLGEAPEGEMQRRSKSTEDAPLMIYKQKG